MGMAEERPLNPANRRDDLSGRVIGEYLLIRRIGSGAMADVYLAEQRSLGRQVALKVLKPHLAEDAIYVRRFQNEARAAASLVHPNIVQIHEVGESQNVHYIAQEYVPGGNLQELIARHGPVNLQTALCVTLQVVAALAKAAERGIVHRDIKPENILLGHDSQVKVADFGLARLGNQEHELNLTKTGMTLGTPLYMSPEQVEGRPLDSRSDIYSVGVTCYHMLAGRPPFMGESALSVAMQHLRGQAVPLETLRPDLPPLLCQTVERMMAKKAEHRYPNARELLRSLRSLQRECGMEDLLESLEFPADSAAVTLEISQLAAATQKLESVIHLANAEQGRLKKRKIWIAAAAVASLLLGGLANFLIRGTSLLAGAKTESVVQQKSAGDQFLQATLARTEDAWLSVAQYFPEETFYVRRSQQELARLYLQQNRLQEAEGVLKPLAELEGDVDSRAFGLAGLLFIHTMRGENEEAAKVLETLGPLREHLDDSNRALIRIALTRLSRAANQESDAEIQSWLQQLEQELPED